MKKVLILEDEVSIRSFVVINLRRAGYEVLEAGTGAEALEKLRQNPDVGVAILDIMLPDIDGFEVCRNIRATDKKIGIITGDLSQFHGRERFRGFKQAIYDSGLSVDPAYIYEGDFTTQKAYELTRQMIASGNMPQAVFLSNNLTSLGFIKAIFEVKMRLGKDICCIGFDYVDAFDILNIGFSYVERDTINMGRMAMHMLMDRIAQPDLPRREHIISASLMLRSSSHSRKILYRCCAMASSSKRLPMERMTSA